MTEGRSKKRYLTHLHAYSMLDIKVTGFTLLTMSITYTTTVGNVDACNSKKHA